MRTKGTIPSMPERKAVLELLKQKQQPVAEESNLNSFSDGKGLLVLKEQTVYNGNASETSLSEN